MRIIRQFISRVTLITALLCFLSACNDANKGKDPMEPSVLDKLVGTWRNDEQNSFERWTKNPDGTFRSTAFAVNGADTLWNEQANVYSKDGYWIFENLVKGQNDDKAVKFTSSILTSDVIQFSNPAHDFPTDINYKVVDSNTVNAFIVGPNSIGGKDTIHFNYKRAQ